MSLPRANKTGQGSLWVDSAPADTSFVTAAPLLMDGRAAVEVVYSGLDAADAYVRLWGSNSGDFTKARCLTDEAATLTTANSAILFNIFEIGYSYLHLEYDAGANTTGSIDADLARKQTS